MSKLVKVLTGVMSAGIVAAAGIAGGVAIAEEQSQTKYEQMLEDEKQSAVDEYKQTINILKIKSKNVKILRVKKANKWV